MAYATKQLLIAALEAKFGAGNVEVDDAPLPSNGQELAGFTQHRIRYLDESGDSGNLLAATAIKKPNGEWLTINEVAAKNADNAALISWVNQNSRPWDKVTSIRHDFGQNSARIETMTGSENPVVERFLVAKYDGGWKVAKIGDGPFA